jgi:two-component system, chemotaxis family, protein-glutamate methylesterase/glutaminase
MTPVFLCRRQATGREGTMDKSIPYFVAIGASGVEGLEDMSKVLQGLPPTIAAVVMIVLHQPMDKGSRLRELLARNSPLPVNIAEDDEVLRAGHCYIGEANAHLTLVGRNRALLVRGTHDELRGRTIDTLFKSLAFHAGRRVIGVVLSGDLDDGSRGLETIHHARGITMVLQPGNEPRGMQQNAIDYDGPISFIGTAPEIAETIVRIVADDAEGTRSPRSSEPTDETLH